MQNRKSESWNNHNIMHMEYIAARRTKNADLADVSPVV